MCAVLEVKVDYKGQKITAPGNVINLIFKGLIYFLGNCCLSTHFG